MKYTVTKAAMRPASNIECCFYCNEPIGGEHKDDCVLIQKRVKVTAEITYEIVVPAFWDEQNIEFHRNESTWCGSNVMDELEELAKKLEAEEHCMCSVVSFTCEDAKGAIYLDEK